MNNTIDLKSVIRDLKKITKYLEALYEFEQLDFPNSIEQTEDGSDPFNEL